jgi:hypothetical protein
MEDTKAKKITASVDAYESDFGTLKVVPTASSAPATCWCCRDMWAIAYLKGRKMVSIPLAKTGDSERRQMLSEYALEAATRRRPAACSTTPPRKPRAAATQPAATCCPAFMLAMPTHRDIPVHTVISLLGTTDLLRVKNIPFEVQVQYGGSIIEATRSKAANIFLKSDKSRLFWIDSDVTWKPEDFIRVLGLSTLYDVIGAAYPAKKDPVEFRLNTEPNVESDDRGCISVNGMGLGFACVSRVVMERLAQDAPVLTFPDVEEPIPHIFRCEAHNGGFRGEDITFFADCISHGFDVKLDPTITLGHTGSKTYSGALIDCMKQL